MTTPDTPKDDTPFEDRTYEVFNPQRTVGVRAAHGGAFTGLYLSEDVRKTTERALTRDILAVASVAAARGRLSYREQLETIAAQSGNPVTANVYDVLPNVPTEQEYEDLKKKTLKHP